MRSSATRDGLSGGSGATIGLGTFLLAVPQRHQFRYVHLFLVQSQVSFSSCLPDVRESIQVKTPRHTTAALTMPPTTDGNCSSLSSYILTWCHIEPMPIFNSHPTLQCLGFRSRSCLPGLFFKAHLRYLSPYQDVSFSGLSADFKKLD